MKEYVSPLVSEIAITETATPNQSGVTPPHKEINKYSGPEWSADIEYCNHNSGSHSEIKFKFHNNGNKSGDNIRCDVVLNTTDGLKISTVTPGDSCLVLSNLTNYGFTLTRTNRHFNGGENIEFVSQIIFSRADGSEGAAGTSEVYRPCDVCITSFNAY